MKNKIMAGSGLAMIISGTHSSCCPVHGILPNLARVTTGSSAALTEYKVLKPFAWLHEKQVGGSSYVLNAAFPQENIAHTCVGHDHHHHHDHEIESIHPYAENAVFGMNFLLMGVSAFYFSKSVINYYKSKKQNQDTQS